MWNRVMMMRGGSEEHKSDVNRIELKGVVMRNYIGSMRL